MSKLPKFGARVLIRFWSLRNKIGAGYGVIFDCDELVQRVCRRVHCDGGWKWQIVNYEKIRLWDTTVDQDKGILDMYSGEEIDAEIVRVL